MKQVPTKRHQETAKWRKAPLLLLILTHLTVDSSELALELAPVTVFGTPTRLAVCQDNSVGADALVHVCQHTEVLTDCKASNANKDRVARAAADASASDYIEPLLACQAVGLGAGHACVAVGRASAGAGLRDGQHLVDAQHRRAERLLQQPMLYVAKQHVWSIEEQRHTLR